MTNKDLFLTIDIKNSDMLRLRKFLIERGWVISSFESNWKTEVVMYESENDFQNDEPMTTSHCFEACLVKIQEYYKRTSNQ